jgi:hypothetical protein
VKSKTRLHKESPPKGGFFIATRDMAGHTTGVGVIKKYQNPKGGLNAAGRAHFKRTEGNNLKPPAPNPKTKADAGRRASFCARMSGMKKKMTSAKTANDPESRINKSLRAWKCN